MHQAAASPEHTELLCWSTWSSSSLGADTGAPLEHMEQWLPWSTESSYNNNNNNNMRSSGSLGADTASPLEHLEQQLPGSTESRSAGARGAAALWEQIQVLHWSTWSSGFPGARGAAALWEQIRVLHWSTWSSGFPGAQRAAAPCSPVKELYLLPERREPLLHGSSIAAFGAPGKPLLHVLQW